MLAYIVSKQKSFEIFCAWNALLELVQLLLFKKREKYPLRSVIFSKVACFSTSFIEYLRTMASDNSLI